jgi:hypothetical protein
MLNDMREPGWEPNEPCCIIFEQVPCPPDREASRFHFSQKMQPPTVLLEPSRGVNLIEEVLRATEPLQCFRVTCYISIPGIPLRLKPTKRVEEGNDALIITKKTTKLTELRVQA